ncbi:MAG: hypothetical protein K9K65_05280 [Desulfarculaceae bacterium]|nr:hypothetical protein [Desulfarculaceae bacterium]MCF8046987.1 hypothetical protein [Desulfarculaceae bacterium]MCF8097235.1 hypothetical protein [Desulfarculaceae bacterium]
MFDFNKKDAQGHLLALDEVRYLLQLDVTSRNLQHGGTLPEGTLAVELSPVNITAYLTEAAAAKVMRDEIKSAKAMARSKRYKGIKVSSFHGHPSVYTFMGFEWREGRFLFNVRGKADKFSQNTIVDVDYMKVAETVHRLAQSTGLLVGDTDGDSVPDDRDRCPNTPSGMAVDASGCPKPSMRVSAKPSHFGIIGDAVTLRARILGPDGRPVQGTKVRLATKSGSQAAVTDTNGVARFQVKHLDRKKKSYEYLLSYGNSKQKIAVPVYSLVVEVKTAKPIVAAPKNLSKLDLTMKGADGKPLANRKFDVNLLAQKAAWLQGGSLHHPGGNSVRVTTDAAGRAKVLYIPPRAAMSAQGAPLGTFPVSERLKVIDVADHRLIAMAELELVSPWPRITKLALPGGDLAGQWQGSDSRVIVADADSPTFDIIIYGPGEFGYSGGHGRQEKLEVLDATSPFHFRFKSRSMGLDLNDIPSNWDMFKDFGTTNAKVLGRLALLMGGNWLLKQHAVTGTAKTVSHTSQVTKTIGGTSKLSSIGGRLGSDIDTTIVTKVKLVTKFENALPEATWATGMLGDADAAISITKNTAEVMNAAGQSRIDVHAAGNMGPAHDVDAALDGMHAGVGVVDTFVTIKDMVTGSPLNVKLELLKGAYENAKMFYNWHHKFQTVADSWEDVTFVPILVEVVDREGHRARRLGRLSIKFSKDMGQQ